MTQLSEHFQSSEFERGGAAIPPSCLPIFSRLCNEILEPVRAYVGLPLTITSGYRPPEENAAIHGSPTSEHVANVQWCAADFTFDTSFGTVRSTMRSIRSVFDWIRNSASLPFHQVILEHGAKGTSIIHVSINETKPGIRQALEGATYNASPYTSWEVAAFQPPQAAQENV